MLGPLLFNLFLCDIFFLLQEINISSLADDDSPFTTVETPNEVINDLKLAKNRILD